MVLPRYLAQTREEFAVCPSLPEHPAWMACHFSPYGTGLSNLPEALPKGSLLILNDRTPVFGHDPLQVAAQLEESVVRLECSGILLDFSQSGKSIRRKEFLSFFSQNFIQNSFLSL
jgi:hypothetical protein